MAKANRECYTCGQRYYYCPTCPSGEKKEVFYNMFCCERCSKIFKTLTNESLKYLTTAQCKEQLLELNVSTKETYKDSIKKHIEKVFSYNEPVAKSVEVVEENEEVGVSETKIIKEVSTTETLVEEDTAKKTNYVPKKNRKVKNSEVD